MNALQRYTYRPVLKAEKKNPPPACSFLMIEIKPPKKNF